MRSLRCSAISGLLVALALTASISDGAAQLTSGVYGCALPPATRVAVAGSLASGGWSTGGGFADLRSTGIDMSRNRLMVRHGGLDLDAPLGAAVQAVRDGRVAGVSTSRHLGTLVVIDHGGGILSVYAYLASSGVTPGTMIARGAPVGTLGFAGDAALVRRASPSAQPRLHLGLLNVKQPGVPTTASVIRRISEDADRWSAALDSLAIPIDPASVLPRNCFATRPTAP